MDKAMIKLKQMLSRQYGKDLEFCHLIDLSMMGTSSEPVVHGNDLYIPIQVQEQFLGAAIIPQGWELSEEMRKSATALIRMVLEPKLYSEYLIRHQSNLQNMNASDLAMNIPRTEERTLITSLLHLQGHDNGLIKKIALQIHDFSGRWAFVSFEDVCQELHTCMDLCNLGALTIFLENIEDLSSEHQEILAQYLKSPRSLSEPLILTSSTLPLEKLYPRLVNTALVSDIQDSHLEVQRSPLNSNVLRELLDLFFYREESQDLH
ncbi:MAG: hypothetical protein ACXWRE_10045 [Pseudobdellovibrionaceae bacterium]